MFLKKLTLKDWLEKIESGSELSPLQAKEWAAKEIGVGISTVYRWLKDGNVYIEELGSDGWAGVTVWKIEKTIGL